MTYSKPISVWYAYYVAQKCWWNKPHKKGKKFPNTWRSAKKEVFAFLIYKILIEDYL
jgi:hypothetical protein